MSCESCYNGCVQTVSDECVRYTGIDYAALGVQTGDNLISVEQAIMNKLVPLLNGTGDAISLTTGDVCALVTSYLSAGLTHTSKEWITALSKGECNLQVQIVNINNTLAILNGDYVIGCLTGVTASSDTHDIVQAIINKLCAVSTDLINFELNVNSNYVKLADLNALIAAYLSEQGGSTQNYLKMVPYTAMEYYGPLTNFDGTGAGIVNLGWNKVYLCNGSNGTPDKRGRVGVGAIVGVPGGPLGSVVNPIYAGNPNYAINGVAGANSVILDLTQIPSHNHTASGTTTVTLNDPQHNHLISAQGDSGTVLDGSHILCQDSGQGGNSSYRLNNSPAAYATSGLTSSSLTNITITSNTSNNVSVAVNNTGSGQAHNNIQPVLAAYYIMYIP